MLNLFTNTEKILLQPVGYRICQILKHGFFSTGIRELISHWQKKNVLIVMVHSLINNDLLEPSYNDLNSWYSWSETAISFSPA